jgi:ATP-dependent Lon protease
VLPLLPVRDIVIFPYMTLPLFVGREGSVAAVDEALARDRYIFLATQRDPSVEDPKEGDLHRTGTVAMIMRMLKLPDGRLKILIQGVVKAKIVEFIEAKPAVRVRIDRIVESPMKEGSLEVEALMRASREKIEKILSLKNMPVEILMVTENINNPGVLADLVASNLRLKIEEAQSVLEEEDPVVRLNLVGNLLSRELQLAEMQAKMTALEAVEVKRLADAKAEADKKAKDAADAAEAKAKADKKAKAAAAAKNLNDQYMKKLASLGYEGDDAVSKFQEAAQIDKGAMGPQTRRMIDKAVAAKEDCTAKTLAGQSCEDTKAAAKP